MDDLKFKLNEKVVISVAKQKGVVIGQAKYLTRESAYLIRHKNSANKDIEQWWDESELGAAK